MMHRFTAAANHSSGAFCSFRDYKISYWHGRDQRTDYRVQERTVPDRHKHLTYDRAGNADGAGRGGGTQTDSSLNAAGDIPVT